ncbi:thioredoxin domain-containing protein [Nostoc sp. CENA67]|uniref:Thioredoxin domain-containing protein n=1 Tax=Amazonocrinis nigriterrae CENA67 TaxID=2794033 RepID=A0A8J7HR83_9NOST|nr:thioredoxin domain-containing protein [Amazonocrinis nigriterrae]MBH8564207.1 thioredoxin domain-containing protein [Amazonocrinis nigriterrae CENA67]
MRQFFDHLRTWLILGLVCLVLGWSLPAQAVSEINPQLEQQVLQILRQHPEVILESVQAYQQQQQQKFKQAQQAFLQDLNNNPQVVIGNSPTIGPAQSKTVLIEFSDFQCPYCAEAHKTLKSLLANHQNDLILAYKHLPLAAIHAEALPAAQAAWAANQQGKFWEYHDALFANQKQLGEDLYLDIAKKLNLDLQKFQRDRLLANTAIGQDIQLAQKLGIAGTPTFVMNSKNFSGAVQLSDIESKLAESENKQIQVHD